MNPITDLLDGDDAPWMDDPRRSCAPSPYATPAEIRDFADAWFPTISHGPYHAARLCAGCPAEIKTACLAYALEHDERGIWAGTTDDDRKRLRGGVVA